VKLAMGPKRSPAVLIFSLIGAGIYLFIFAAYFLIHELFARRETYRYDLGFEVDDGGIVRIASSSIRVKWRDQIKFGNTPRRHAEVHGSSPVMDLGDRGLIVMLLRPTADAFGRGHAEVVNLKARPSSLKDQLSTGVRDLPAALNFQFIWVRDPDDIASIRDIEPDEFSSVLGADCRFGAIAVRPFSGPIIPKLQTRGRWVTDIRDGHPRVTTPVSLYDYHLNGVSGQRPLFRLPSALRSGLIPPRAEPAQPIAAGGSSVPSRLTKAITAVPAAASIRTLVRR
jgi:hypothetical protein